MVPVTYPISLLDTILLLSIPITLAILLSIEHSQAQPSLRTFALTITTTPNTIPRSSNVSPSQMLLFQGTFCNNPNYLKLLTSVR